MGGGGCGCVPFWQVKSLTPFTRKRIATHLQIEDRTTCVFFPFFVILIYTVKPWKIKSTSHCSVLCAAKLIYFSCVQYCIPLLECVQLHTGEMSFVTCLLKTGLQLHVVLLKWRKKKKKKRCSNAGACTHTHTRAWWHLTSRLLPLSVPQFPCQSFIAVPPWEQIVRWYGKTPFHWWFGNLFGAKTKFHHRCRLEL